MPDGLQVKAPLLAAMGVALSLALITAPAQGAPLGLQPEDVAVHRLNNGMTFLILERPLAPTVSLMIEFNAITHCSAAT